VFPEVHEARGFARAAWIDATYRARGLAGACFRGERSPGEHRPDDLTLARAWGRRENGLPRGVKLRSGRAGRLPASPTVFEQGEACGRRASARTTDFSRRCGEPCVPAHASGEPSGLPWQRVGARGKAPLKLGGRRAGGGRTRTHKEATARESGYGSSRGESSVGRLQGRERHGTRPRSFGASRKTACSARGAIRSAFAARTVERGKNPEDGTGESSASSRPPQRRLSCRCGVRGTRRSCVRGRNKPRRGGSRATRTIRPASADVAVREHGRQRRDELCRGTEPHERISWNSRPGSQLDEENPAAGPNGEGGAPEANKALLGESKLLRKEPRVSEGDGHLMRGRPDAGDRGRPPCLCSVSEGQSMRTAKRRRSLSGGRPT